jgi:hypothetical protein
MLKRCSGQNGSWAREANGSDTEDAYSGHIVQRATKDMLDGMVASTIQRRRPECCLTLTLVAD